MSTNNYTEERIAKLIEIANLYVDDPGIRTQILSRFHQEIGRLVAGAEPRSAMDMNRQEFAALKDALARWREERRKSPTLESL